MIAAPASGGGDSIAPTLSADGRYVLFASSADNLTTHNGVAAFGPTPARLNVYLRDRTNGTTTLVSVNISGAGGGNNDSRPIEISADNRYVLFEGSASDLVPYDTNNSSDVFVRDLVLGTTILVSANPGGGVANRPSHSSIMTSDGRYVAFVSEATDIVSGDTNGIPDIFVRDLQTGTTVCASPGAAAVSTASGSESPVLTPDGRYVAFFSTATNLAAGAGGPGNSLAGDVYLRDLTTGQTFLASTNARAIAAPILGTSNAIACYGHALSDDGQHVVYEASKITFVTSPPTPTVVLRFNLQTGLTDLISSNAETQFNFENARNLDMTPDGRFVVYLAGRATNVFLWDALSNTTTLISEDLSHAAPIGATCEWPVIDASGRYVTFFSTASNLTTSPLTGEYNLYVRDVQAATTAMVNIGAGGIGTVLNPVSCPSLSADSGLIAFESRDATLVPDDNNNFYDVFVRDLAAGTNELISAHHPLLPTSTALNRSTLSILSLSSNGQFVAFSSRADDLALNDTNRFRDVFYRDLVAGTNLLISVNTNGTASGDNSSWEPAISGNGRFVAFTSRAGNLVSADTTNYSDVFIRDTQTGTTTLVSVNTSGTGHGDPSHIGDSLTPVVSANGHFVIFNSQAKDLVPGAIGGNINLFLRDLQNSTTVALTTNNSSLVATMTPDGRYIAYNVTSPSLLGYVYDTQLGQRIYTNTLLSPSSIGISPNGARLAYVSSGAQVGVADLVAHTNGVIASVASTNPGLRFSRDGRFLAYATTSGLSAADTNQLSDIYLYDFQTQTNMLISRSFISGMAANGGSDSPDISSDSRFIAYRSSASDIVPGDSNNLPDIFLYDRFSNTVTLVSASCSAAASGNGRSVQPVFSGDGQTLAFESWAENLTSDDHNQTADIFLLGISAPPFTDSDNDGMADDWEMKHFGTLARDGTGDFDGDGVSDLVEFQTGTDPADPASFFHVELLPLVSSGSGTTLSWPADGNRSYQVQFKASLNDLNWSNLDAQSVFVGGKAYANDPAPRATQKFYRVVFSN